MGKRGPQPQPAELKRLRGNPGKRAIPAVPVAEAATFACPSRLRAYKSDWDKYALILSNLGILRATDGIAWEAMFDALDWYVSARKREDSKEMLTWGKELRTWLDHFGMSPSSRSGLQVEAPKGESEFEKFLARKST